jgi:LacI family transcriptional regulator
MNKRPTIQEIAREVGVSISAVSHAFNKPTEISAELRERIMHVAQERGYRPDPRARSLRRGESSLIALVVSTLSNVYFSGLAQAIQETIAVHGYHLVVLNSKGTEHGERDSLDTMQHEGMAGAIVDLYRLKPEAAIKVAAGRPVVFIADHAQTVTAPAVRVDNYTAAYDVVRYLAGQGRRRIAHITGPATATNALRRRAGYRKAVRDYKLGQPIEAGGDFTFEAGRRALETFLALPERPDAIFAANDLMAIGALTALREQGVRVPEEIAIAGFDNIDEAARTIPPLTTVDQPTGQIGSAAANLLLTSLRDPAFRAVIDVKCALVPRASG